MNAKLEQKFNEAIEKGWFDSIEEIEECFGNQPAFETVFNCEGCPLSAECDNQ